MKRISLKHRHLLVIGMVALIFLALAGYVGARYFLQQNHPTTQPTPSTVESDLSNTPSPSPIVSPVATASPTISPKPLVKPSPKPSPSPSPTASPDLNMPQKEATSYSLTPARNPQRVRIDAYPDSEYAYVILRNQDGEIIRDQSNVNYEWQVANGSMVEYTLARAPGYICYPLENDIKQPCPNFAAYLKGHFPGETTITVTASIPGKGIIGRTQFQVVTYEDKKN